MMYPLLVASLITVTIAVERFSLYRRSGTNMALIKAHLPQLLMDGEYCQATALCEKAGGIVGGLLTNAIAHRRVVNNLSEFLSGESIAAASRLKDHLNYVSAIVTIAPLLGLLGTVTGMINSFDVLSIAEGQPFAITGGVAEALVATAFGLLVAIVAMMIHVWLSQVVNRLISNIEMGASLCLTSIKED
ncbi:MotA/TolQ/ExbB proton channel family protein [Budvicia aquatica]|nr:MotA/TolQ/ExbB proton channel family protein [Budvicia aquatica]VFS49063.1 colicin uptake protein TolQ [Budvicia aquatica]